MPISCLTLEYLKKYVTLGIYPVYKAFLSYKVLVGIEKEQWLFSVDKNPLCIFPYKASSSHQAYLRVKQDNEKKSRRKILITIYLLCLSCTRLIILFKKKITLENHNFTRTVKRFNFKLHNSLAHIIHLSHLTHIFIALPQIHYNKTDEPAAGRDVRMSRK